MKKPIQVIGFDADDTLWGNENYYRKTEIAVAMLLKDFGSREQISEMLYQTEMQNLHLYGFGAKAFMLSLIETTLKVSNHNVKQAVLDEIINLGKALLEHPIDLLPGVEDVLTELQTSQYRIVAITKGELLDQERKFNKSGIAHYFESVNVMSNKQRDDYQKLFDRLNIQPASFVMVGNSLPSDVIPVVELGARAIHIPYHTTWQHETTVEEAQTQLAYQKIETITQLPLLLKSMQEA